MNIREFPWVDVCQAGKVVSRVEYEGGETRTYVFYVDGRHWRASIEWVREAGWTRKEMIRAVEVSPLRMNVPTIVWEEVE